MSSIKGWCSYAIYPIYRRTKSNGKLRRFSGVFAYAGAKNWNVSAESINSFTTRVRASMIASQCRVHMDFQTAVQELLGQTVTPLSHSPPKVSAKEEKERVQTSRGKHKYA